MAPPITAATVVACGPGSVSPVEVIGSGSGSTSSGHTTSNKNCYFNEDTFKLIECVKARPALWHRKHLRQRVQVAHRGWEEIRKAFKATEVTSLKVRWKTLRDSFRREVKRIEDGEIVTSSWPLFDKMSFLIGHFRTRESYLKNGTSSPSQTKSNEHWKFSSLNSQEPQTDEEPVHNNATSSMGESESEVVESFVVYDDPKATTYETVVATSMERLESDDTATGAAVEIDPEDLHMIETYEEKVGSNGKREANSSQDVIEVPSHLFGEVTFKNKLRARIKTEPVEKVMEGAYGMEADSDYNFLMSLHPFMKQLSGKKNLSVRIKIQQVIAEAMDEN
ncbi:uncharacterized protein LOC135709358 [Ochlerotatus camptorhynchus]|uniref:uncharacterized protein LOC135709358 n=1 Tax=Ochlerotatus camptorhynchus TaxID=644619 RepID=UPI0031D13C99